MTETITNQERQGKDKRRRAWTVRLLVALLLLLLFAAVAVAVYLYSLVDSLKRTAEQMYQPLPAALASRPLHKGQPASPRAAGIEDVPPITILLLGIDQWAQDKGRTDTMILAAVHPGKKSTLLLSIPRDTRVKLAGSGAWDKINHSYAYGGTEMTLHTVYALLKIPLDYYISVNMDGFERIIDELGGVEVHNQTAYQYWGYQFPEGKIQLDGERALAYARMRYYDPKGDLGRNQRQQQVLKGLLEKLKQPSLLTDYERILSQVSEHVKTNIQFAEWRTFISSYRPAAENIETEQLAGRGELIDGIYYYIVSPEEINRVRGRFQAFLASAAEFVPRPLGGAMP